MTIGSFDVYSAVVFVCVCVCLCSRGGAHSLLGSQTLNPTTCKGRFHAQCVQPLDPRLGLGPGSGLLPFTPSPRKG